MLAIESLNVFSVSFVMVFVVLKPDARAHEKVMKLPVCHWLHQCSPGTPYNLDQAPKELSMHIVRRMTRILCISCVCLTCTADSVLAEDWPQWLGVRRDSVWRETKGDDDGLVTSGAAIGIDCKNTLLRSEAKGTEIVGIGLENIVAIAMPDAVLVADKSRAQDVKLAVDALKQKKSNQAVQFPRDHRPWGSFESLYMGPRFQVKRIVVKPGGSLSLQSHVHRSEHWVVVEGTAKVTIGDVVKLVSDNESVYIPLGEKHRMENPGKVPMVLIEVQTGSYLGEDDIVRYEDVYARD